jgi:hypothetical protein
LHSVLKEIHECTAVGERGSEMAHLGDAVAAYRAALRGGIVAVSLATGSAQRQPYFACSVARYRARDAAEQPAPVIRYRRCRKFDRHWQSHSPAITVYASHPALPRRPQQSLSAR